MICFIIHINRKVVINLYIIAKIYIYRVAENFWKVKFLKNLILKNIFENPPTASWVAE